MDNWRKQFKNLKLINDIINTVVGIALIISIVIVLKNPMNGFAILAACTLGGLLNLLNGFKQLKDPKRKSTGMTLIMMGIIVIALGFFIMGIL